MRYLLTSLACLISLSLFGQGWEQTYGSEGYDWGRSVQQTVDGGYVIAGEASIAGSGLTYVYLIKTNENGIEQWSQTYGGDGHDMGYEVHQTSDEGYIIVGETHSFGNGGGDVYIVKTDENGVEQWSQTYGGTEYDIGYSINQTSDQGYIIAGVTSSFGNGWDVYLIKTDENGIEQWSHTYGGADTDYVHSVQQTNDGGYVIGGWTYSFGNGDRDVYLIKTDENGIEQWSQTYGDGGDDVGRSVQQTTDGGYVVAGFSSNATTDALLIKTDENGFEQWSHFYHGYGNEDDLFYSVNQTSEGGYIMTGETFQVDHEQKEVYIVKTDASGEPYWEHMYANQYYSVGYSVQETNDQEFVIAGVCRPQGSGPMDVYLIKTDGWVDVHVINAQSNRKLQKVVDALGREFNQTTNQILFHIYDDGSVEKQFVVE
jgi:hypothetical protein